MNKIQLAEKIDMITETGEGFNIVSKNSDDLFFGFRCVEVLAESYYVIGLLGGSAEIFSTTDHSSEEVAEKVFEFMKSYNSDSYENYYAADFDEF